MRKRHGLLTILPAAMTILAGGCGVNHGRSALDDDRPSTPDESLQALKDGNLRFATGDLRANRGEIDRDEMAASQAPWAAVLRCADSRVAPEIIFDADKGELFVTSVAGNFPTVDLIASMEFAVLNLQTNLIVVCGHSGCGAIEAAIAFGEDPDALPGSLPHLVEALQSPCVQGVAIDEPGAVVGATKCSAAHGARNVLAMSDVLSEQAAKGNLRVVAAYFDIASGQVEFLD